MWHWGLFVFLLIQNGLRTTVTCLTPVQRKSTSMAQESVASSWRLFPLAVNTVISHTNFSYPSCGSCGPDRWSRSCTIIYQFYVREDVPTILGLIHDDAQKLPIEEELSSISSGRGRAAPTDPIARDIGCAPSTVANGLRRGTPPRKSSKGM